MDEKTYTTGQQNIIYTGIRHTYHHHHIITDINPYKYYEVTARMNKHENEEKNDTNSFPGKGFVF